MVKVHFLLEDLLVQAPEGTSLQRVAEASGADITFGCGTGSCGTCRVKLVEGADHAGPLSPEERDYLQRLGAGEGERLACQVRVQGDMTVDYLGL